MAGGGGEQQQRLTQRVELELGVDMVAEDVVPTWVAGQLQGALAGTGPPVMV